MPCDPYFALCFQLNQLFIFDYFRVIFKHLQLFNSGYAGIEGQDWG